MHPPKIFEKEYTLCLILWDKEPIRLRDLARLCETELDWKTTTTYTVVKRLCDRGILRNEDSVITSLVSREEAQAAEIEELVDTKFKGSLPAFFAAFTHRQRLSAEEIYELQAMIDRAREEGGK